MTCLQQFFDLLVSNEMYLNAHDEFCLIFSCMAALNSLFSFEGLSAGVEM